MGETTDVWILPHVEGWYQVGCAVCEFAAHEQDYAAAYEIADLHLDDHSPRPRTSSPWVPATLGGCAAFLPGVGHDLSPSSDRCWRGTTRLLLVLTGSGNDTTRRCSQTGCTGRRQSLRTSLAGPPAYRGRGLPGSPDGRTELAGSPDVRRLGPCRLRHGQRRAASAFAVRS